MALEPLKLQNSSFWGVVKKRTGEEVLSDIGGASTGFAIAQAVALG